MTYLLDANVLIALGWTAHTHHDAANQWLPGKQFATCAQTQLAFLRLSTHPKLPYRATMQDARATLHSIVTRAEHEFWPMDLRPLHNKPEAKTHEELNDAYLLALAKSRAARLVTFDGPHTSICRRRCRVGRITVNI